VNSAEIYASKESATVMLLGGDASESYTLKILFNAERVKRRIVVSGEFGDVSQETTYFQVEH
jgi:hypothetical protein